MPLGQLLNALTKCLVLPGPFFSGSGWTHLELQDGHVWDCYLAYKVGVCPKMPSGMLSNGTQPLAFQLFAPESIPM